MKEIKCLTEGCDLTSYTKGLCKKHYWNKLYHENRITSKNGRGKLRPKPIIYFDGFLNKIAPPGFRIDGTTNSPFPF